MAPQKRRFKTEEEIIREIDKYKERARLQLIEACKVESDGHEMIRKSGLEEFSLNALALDYYGKEALKRAASMRTGATNIINGKLRNLQGKLAEFRTEVMPFMGEDRSIEV